jgi:hypothetical protein
VSLDVATGTDREVEPAVGESFVVMTRVAPTPSPATVDEARQV